MKPTISHLANILISYDKGLEHYRNSLEKRLEHVQAYSERILEKSSIKDFAHGHRHFGLHKTSEGWVYRDWAPAATKIYLVGEFSGWADEESFALEPIGNGEWGVHLPNDAFRHGSHYKLHVYWPEGDGYRVPAWATYVVQDPKTKQFDAVVWNPPHAYEWQDSDFKPAKEPLLIYETHVGMSGEKADISTYKKFTRDVIPRVKAAGYNTIQIMAIAEHPYYGSFGYHVSSFFAPSSRFGSPDDLRALIDTAHQFGIRVIMDLVHSHAVKNEVEGISRYDGSLNQFFYSGTRGDHEQWDSRVFDYGKPEVAHFLLSNCRYWIDEFHIDGFRFDGVSSMLYTHHGIGKSFDSYDVYFSDVDSDALSYLTLANELIHEINADAVTIAEDMSGMPGIAASIDDGGIGFDYRLSMGVPDLWVQYVKDVPDEKWVMSKLFYELSLHRPEEKTISYVESHDQALVGDKTLMFRMADKAIYQHMQKNDQNLVVDRALALHKMIRLLTGSLHHGGYMNFMGNEFGHPEWIDFPREGNNWSYHYARRQWSLVDDKSLKYEWLNRFDKEMITLIGMLSGEPDNVSISDDNHTISYCRGTYVFAYNFHPSKSYENYEVAAPAGNYRIILSSDDSLYGGQDRIDFSITYPSDDSLKLYIPARTAIVFQRSVQ
jgi:1,4-alpha-glucan branching enzyme